MKNFTGIAASLGFAIGPVFLYERQELVIDDSKVDNISLEVQRLEKAITVAKQQLAHVYEQAKKESGEAQAEIFSAQSMFLDDPDLMGLVKETLENQKVNIEYALHQAFETYAHTLETLEDEYLRARALDVRDVGQRLLRILKGVAESPTEALKQPSIVVAKDLTPSDTVLIDKKFLLGFCIAQGGATSHTAILARGLGLPAVVGMGDEVLKCKNGQQVILDGSSGALILEPSADMVKTYQEKIRHYELITKQSQAKAMEPAITTDGRRVEVVANIGNVTSAKKALDAGAEGVGLLRSEFLYLERSNFPSEEEQYQSYKSIADAFGKQPVILRSLDIGGDKELSYLNMPVEANPFLGVRAIRLCFTRPDLFKPQLRAALRAGVGNNLKLMFPMVATVDEVRQARAILNECCKELKAEGIQVAEKMDIGIMIEIPSAAITADQLAKEIDFFSIGTNDLSQYTMAADRTNAQVAYIASSFQPAVLRLVKMVIDAAHAEKKWVGMCGELAGEPLAIPILLGLGLDEFSMNPPAIPIAKQIIRSLSIKQAKEIAEKALSLENSDQVQAYVRKMVPVVNL
jgi:phosphoenolpyruvate-protein phosphotransferase (PTS system enzyme I)